MRRVLVCEAQVPFVEGGAESLVRELVAQLRAHGFEADRASVPFKWYPKEEILGHAAAWRLVDLSESGGRPIDLVITTKFPTYFVRHPHKVAWLLHQYRAAYELCGTPYSEFDHTDLDVGLRARLVELDERMLGECVARYAISATTAARLERYNGLTATPLYHPSRLSPRLRSGPYGDYFLSVGRLEIVKRVDLPIRAMLHVPRRFQLLIVGEGTYRDRLEELAVTLGVGDRVRFLGAVGDDELIDLYAGCRAVVFAPYDEDYGYVTLEAFGASKPIVTGEDSGGVLELVRDRINGFVCAPHPEALGDALGQLAASTALAASLGDAGRERARAITWDGVIAKLTESLAGSPVSGAETKG